MKLFVLLAFAVLAASSVANAFNNSDWSTVRPVIYYPKFWDNKAPELRPPAKFFEIYENPTRNAQTRIVGGQEARSHQFPYRVALLTFLPSIGGNGFCGGSFIGRRTVLTAAHCVDGGINGTAIFGAHYWRTFEPSQQRIDFDEYDIFVIDSWDSQLIQNDVEVVQLRMLLEINLFVRPAILPTTDDVDYDFANENGISSGWGVTSREGVVSESLRYYEENILTRPQCTASSFGLANANNICLSGNRGRSACNGDSGGPATVRRGGESMHVGITSFVIASCFNSLPSIYARTTSHLSWISAKTV